MRVLLDECLPRKLKSDLSGHDAATVPEMGWSGLKNGELLRVAESAFDVFVTIDRGLQYQQNLQKTKLGVILLAASNNRLETLRPLMPQVLATLDTIRTGKMIRIEAETH
jgi:predicted nuclease of predicted toxin-antitoxin system